MSIKALVWAFGQIDPSPMAKFVLVTLGDTAGDDAETQASVHYLTKYCNMTPDQVRTALGELCRLGLIRYGETSNTRSGDTEACIFLTGGANNS